MTLTQAVPLCFQRYLSVIWTKLMKGYNMTLEEHNLLEGSSYNYNM